MDKKFNQYDARAVYTDHLAAYESIIPARLVFRVKKGLAQQRD